jgi:predicted ester cyclase
VSAEHNKAAVQGFIDGIRDFWRTGSTAFIDNVLDRNFADYATGLSPSSGLENLRKDLPAMRAAMPDWEFTIHDMIAEGDTVARRMQSRGTFKTRIMGVEPPSRQIIMREMQFFKVRNGKIVERRCEADALGMMQQIGIALVPQK